ncbi:MAG: alpha-1,4-glucan--maltose-1-phosphate maltosyltransferase [Nitrososphaerales archaeon]
MPKGTQHIRRREINPSRISAPKQVQRDLDFISILNLSPQIDCGRYPVKRIIGETLCVSADVLKPGHGSVIARICHKKREETNWVQTEMAYDLDNDRWFATFPLKELGIYEYFVEAWIDNYSSKLEDLKKWTAAGENVSADMEELMDLIKRATTNSTIKEREDLSSCLNKIQISKDIENTLKLLSDPELSRIVINNIDKQGHAKTSEFRVIVDRDVASFSTWYEMFPRSQGKSVGASSSFKDCESRLGDIRAMGFDVIYLPPIHPIGHTNRRGPNNTPSKGASDPGSPWAIGDEHGGHYSIDPELGSMEDFLHFVKAAHEGGLEIALDLAYQCSPDHPYVKEHPEWFYHRKDGTIRYAENPPKKYYDLYPFYFQNSNWKELWNELLKIAMYWAEKGIRMFRVDNPHTKPIGFWEWLILNVKTKYPDVIFLAESFTRPKSMKLLAKIGFTQSYTYFTWKNTKKELTEFLNEFILSDAAEYYRGNFFANTPDILSEYLQNGGRPAFKIRLILAATLSSIYGIYNGFELCENQALAPDSEEYMNSEKYEYKIRNWNAPNNIKDYISKVNVIRKENVALHYTNNLKLLECDSEDIFFFGKWTQDRSNIILVAVNLDPFAAHHCTVKVPIEELSIDPSKPYKVKDLLTGNEYEWLGESNYVKLDPKIEPAHILLITNK